jgi:hypothetical protein
LKPQNTVVRTMVLGGNAPERADTRRKPLRFFLDMLSSVTHYLNPA